MSSPRLAEFLSRAQAINNNPTPHTSNKERLANLRNITTSPIFPKKNSLSPISYQSFSSTHDNTPIHTDKKFVLSGTFNGKKNLSVNIIPRESLENNVKSPKVKESRPGNPRLPPTVPERKKVSYKIPAAKLKEEIFTKDNVKCIDSTKEKEGEFKRDPLIEEAECKGKKKIEKMIGIFREEALKMDQKLQKLQIENKTLKEIMENPQLPIPRRSGSVKGVLSTLANRGDEAMFAGVLEDLCSSFRKIENLSENQHQINNWFECLEIENGEFESFLSAIGRKILQEQQKRMKTEEETGKMIDSEENMIKELERKVANAEVMTRKTSSRIFHELFEMENVATFDRNVAANNLKAILERASKNN